jgi:NADPH2:quinone reductase
MKAVRFSKFGGPEVLVIDEIDLPEPGPGQVQIHHTAIGVNFIDTYQRTGLYPVPLPSGLGLEAAGVVARLGSGVTSLKEGDRVAYCSGPLGAYAQANNVSAERLVKLPESISDEVAAASLLKGMTVQYLLKRTFAVKTGQTIVVHAAAGGVGLIAGQWAKHLGVTAIGTVGSEEKIALAKANGYAHVLSSRDSKWPKQVREITNGEGVPVVYDSVGKDTFDGSLDSLAVRGLLVSFGNASGAVPAFEPAILSAKGSLYLTRPTLAHYTRNAKELQETADDLFLVIGSGAVKIQIHQRFKLEEARKAHEALHSRTTTGATVLTP